MWFKPKQASPQTDSAVHWLGERGIIVRSGLTIAAWAAKADDPEDPTSLALARDRKGSCVQPRYVYHLTDEPVATQVGSMADALELPIDEAAFTDHLAIRHGSTWIDIDGVTPIDQLRNSAQEFTDHLHRIITTPNSIILIHVDVIDEADRVFRQAT